MKTGYFEITGSGQRTKTHVVEGGQPICKTFRVSDRAIYQACSMNISLGLIECKRCLELAKRVIQQRAS